MLNLVFHDGASQASTCRIGLLDPLGMLATRVKFRNRRTVRKLLEIATQRARRCHAREPGTCYVVAARQPRQLGGSADPISRLPQHRSWDNMQRQPTRREFIAASVASAPLAACGGRPQPESYGLDTRDLDLAAAEPVLNLSGLDTPLIIDSIRLLENDGEQFVHVRTKDGAEGVSLTNGRRYLGPILRDLVIPFFLGKDARKLESELLFELYRYRSNYKLQGLALWSVQAWVEFALLDMMGRAFFLIRASHMGSHGCFAARCRASLRSGDRIDGRVEQAKIFFPQSHDFRQSWRDDWPFSGRI